MGHHILVIGDAMLDVQARPSTPMRAGSDVPADIRLGPGGQGANLAVRLARRGLDVGLLCAIGDDPAGRLVRAWLAAEDVAVVEGAPAGATGTVVVLLTPGGERTMLSRRVPLALPPPAVDARWVVVSGYALRDPGAEALPTLPWLPQRRMLVGCALSAAEAQAWTTAARSLQPALVVLNRAEAATLCGSEAADAELAARLGADLGGIVIVTADAGATAWLGDGASVGVEAEPITPVDTTGAGDAFAAAVLAELVDGPWPPRFDAMYAALGVAAQVATAVAGVDGAQGRVRDEGTARMRP